MYGSTRRVTVSALSVLIGVAVALATACSSGSASQVTEVTGNSGMCTNSDTRWSGEPPAGLTFAELPGRVVESVVMCPKSEMSDDRLSGAVETEILCEFTNRSDELVADCTSNSVVTNDGGTWEEVGGAFTITGTGIGVQGVVVQEGLRVGTGDYEGLQFAYRMEGVEKTYPWSITGTIEPTR